MPSDVSDGSSACLFVFHVLSGGNRCAVRGQFCLYRSHWGYFFKWGMLPTTICGWGSQNSVKAGLEKVGADGLLGD